MPRQRTALLFRVPTPGVSRRKLNAFVKLLESRVAGGASFGCLITSDREIRRLNREFRKQDYATDVLSFPALERDGLLGEIAISFDRAREQASEHRHNVSEEIKVLMLHGVLHLLGMDHATDGGRMARAERKWRVSLRLSPGLIERVRS